MDNSVNDGDDDATQDDDDGFTHLEHLDLVLGGKFVAFTHVCSQFVRQSLNSAYRHFKRVTRFFPLPFLIPLEAILSLLLGFTLLIVDCDFDCACNHVADCARLQRLRKLSEMFDLLEKIFRKYQTTWLSSSKC